MTTAEELRRLADTLEDLGQRGVQLNNTGAATVLRERAKVLEQQTLTRQDSEDRTYLRADWRHPGREE